MRPLSGEIYLKGSRINGLCPEEIMSVGIVQVPEGRRIFPGLTVFENLLVPAITWSRKNRELDEELDRGEQQMLAIGRAMMGRPKVMLLDEPSLGLAPDLVDDPMVEKAYLGG